jgi:hypothetical protein
LQESLEYWYNTKTKTVEVGPQSLSLDRVGPFSSAAEASRAPEIIAERARKIRNESEQEDDWS